MDSVHRDRLLGFWQAFDSPFVVGVTAALAALLVAVYLGARLLHAAKRIDQETYTQVVTRWRSWVWLTVAILTPVLLGALWVMLAVMVLSMLCFREYARVTGLFREKTIGAVVILGTLAVTFAAFDRWDRLFFACAPLVSGLVAVVTLPQDRPKGYIQRVALGVLGFVFFGYSFGYLGYLANAPDYRPVLVLILLAVAMNDVAAYCVGKTVGGPRLLTATSPGKTVAGSLGGLVLTTGLVVALGPLVFAETPVNRIDRLLILGLLIGGLGQLGRLVLSSIKRDVEVKETGTALPGHGGLLDRFDSLVLVPPAVFHYLSLLQGPLGGPAQRLLTGPP
jgi:phosphatidate cytidylyltransferase